MTQFDTGQKNKGIWWLWKYLLVHKKFINYGKQITCNYDNNHMYMYKQISYADNIKQSNRVYNVQISK